MTAVPAWDAALPALAGLMAVAGAAKVARPGDTARALRSAGLRTGSTAVRVGAAGELAVGAAVLAGAGAGAVWLLAASYLGFAGFVGAALWRGWPLASCGCFGQPDTPPTATHALVCLAAAAATAGAAAWGRPAGIVADLSAEGPYRGVMFLVLSVAGAYAAYLVMSAAPRLAVARAALRRVAAR